jgi:biopolymer transport protein ExbD
MALNIRAGHEPEPEVMVDINTTPLVDVLLVLLVMLIVTIPAQLHTANLELPSPNTPPPQTPPPIVQIEVTAAGGFVWDGRPVADRTELERLLREAAERPDAPEIHLRPEAAAKYEPVAAVLSSAQRLGLQKVGIVGAEQFAPRQ